jgi:protein TonB
MMPEFPGGLDSLMRFMVANLKYPLGGKEAQGTVLVAFIIDTDGSISDPQVVQGIGPAYDIEALRVVSIMPDWTPGILDGTPVRVSYVLPIKFSVK